MKGYTGRRMLNVDVSGGKAEIEPMSDTFTRTYVGGNGFAARLLFDRVAVGADPLSPENLVVFGVGPATDALPGCRGYIAFKSPLTGLYCDSTFGGRFAVTQKRTGFECVAIAGKSESPVVVLVDEEGAKLHDASELWGLGTRETIQRLKEQFGEAADVAAIGAAGEAGVRYACVSHFWKGRPGIAGRGGGGAALGAKNVKAVVVTGARKTVPADPDGLAAFVKEGTPGMLEKAEALSKYGTPVLTEMINKMGGLGARNAQREYTEDVSAAGTEAFSKLYQKRLACYHCPIACGKLSNITDGPYAGLQTKVVEYESIYALGAMLDVFDARWLIHVNKICDDIGVDTISMGVTLAFVAECLEKGLLSSKEVGYEEIFSNTEAILSLIDDTVSGKGFGVRLTEGSARLAEQIGPEASKFLYVSKKMEIAGHSPRALKGLGLGYATGTRGGSHHDTRPSTMYPAGHDNTSIDGQAQLSFDSQNMTALGDSLTVCRFISERLLGHVINEQWAQVLRLTAGWDMDVAEAQAVGERIYNLERCFNVREGVRADQDVLSQRSRNEPIPDGALAGARCSNEDLNAMRSEYYRIRGWDENGFPSRRTLERLGLRETLKGL